MYSGRPWSEISWYGYRKSENDDFGHLHRPPVDNIFESLDTLATANLLWVDLHIVVMLERWIFNGILK